MLTFGIYFLTAVLVIDCLFLVLLVLVQLPKKDAGAGMAFGGGATDALFGAGSGNVLTKVTKWCAGIFFGLAIVLTILGNYKTTSGGGAARLQKMLGEAKTAAPIAPPIAPVVPPAPNAVAATNAAAPAVAAPKPIDLKLPTLTNALAVPTNK